MTQGFIYFAGYDKTIKIGKSITPNQRISALNTANPNTIQLYAYIEVLDMDALEPRIHSYFSPAHIKGEWYELTSEMRYLIIGLQSIKNPTEFDIGTLLGQYTKEAALAMMETNYNNSMAAKWQRQIADGIRRKLWALEYTIQSLGLTDFAMFRDRLTEVAAVIDTVPEGKTPLLMRDKAGRLTNGVVASEDTEAA